MQTSEFDIKKLKSIGITLINNSIVLTNVKSKEKVGEHPINKVSSIKIIKTNAVESDPVGFFNWIFNLRGGGSNSFAEEIIHKIIIFKKNGAALQSTVIAFDKIGVTKAIERLNEKIKSSN